MAFASRRQSLLLPGEKPERWSIDEYDLAYNASRMGLPVPEAFWALWEGGGNNIYDLSGNNRNFSLVGGPPWRPEGLLDFDGSTQYAVQSGRVSDATQGTIEARVVLRNIDPADKILSYGGGLVGIGTPGLFGMELRVVGDLWLSVIQRSDGEAANVCRGSTTPLSYGQSYQLVVTSNGSLWKLYVDTEPQTIVPIAGSNTGGWFGDTTVTYPDRTTLANVLYNGNYTGYAEVDIEFVRIWDSELSAEQIATLYEDPYGLVRQPRRLWAVPIAGGEVKPLANFIVSPKTFAFTMKPKRFNFVMKSRTFNFTVS